jgi:hypothetical protein
MSPLKNGFINTRFIGLYVINGYENSFAKGAIGDYMYSKQLILEIPSSYSNINCFA